MAKTFDKYFAEVKKRVHSRHVFVGLSISVVLLLILNLMKTKYASYFLGILIPLALEVVVLYVMLFQAAKRQKAVLDYEFAINQFKAWLELKSAPDPYRKKNLPPPKKPKPIFYENSFTEMHAQAINAFRNSQDSPGKEVVDVSLPLQDVEVKLPEEEKSLVRSPIDSQKKAPSRERSPNQKPASNEMELTIQSSKKAALDKTPLKGLSEEKVAFKPLYHKNFVAQINSFLEVLRTISNSDKHYGKGLRGLGIGSTSIFSQEEGLFDHSLHENSFVVVTDLGVKEKALFIKRFGEQLVKKQKIILPEWRVIRNTINAVGNIHLECATGIEKATIDLVLGLNQQYNEGHLEAKRSRKKYKEEYERCYTNYTKTVSDYETAQKNLETVLADYQQLVKKKEDASTLLKLEIKARMLKQEIDSIKNKLADAKDQVEDARNKASEENERIKAFVASWNEQREDVFRHTMRTVISILEENLADVDLSFENLISSVNEFTSTPEKRREEEKHEEEKHDEASEAEIPKDDPVDEASTQNPEERQDTSSADIGSEFTARGDENLDSKARKYIASAEIKRKNEADRRTMTMLPNQQKLEGGHASKTTDDILRNPTQTTKYSYDNIKHIIDTAAQKLATYQTAFAEKIKTGKNIESIFKLLIAIEEQYQNESSVLCNSSFLNLDNSELGKIWKIFKHNFFLSNRIRLSLIEKLVLSHRELLDFLKITERDPKQCESIYTQALKKFTPLLNDLKKGPVDERTIEQKAENFKREVANGDKLYAEAIFKMEDTYSKLKKKLIYLYLDLNDANKERLNALIAEADILTIRGEKKLSSASPDDKDRTSEGKNRNFKPFIIEKAQNSTKNLGAELASSVSEAKQKLKPMPKGENGQQIQEITELDWFNKLLNIFAMDWCVSGYFRHILKKTLLKEFKDLENEFIHSFKIEPHFPKVERMIALPCDKYEFLYDLDLDYTGTIMMDVEAKVEMKGWLNATPVHGKLAVKQLKGTLRVCFVPGEYGASWLCFVEEPKISFHIDLEYGHRKKFFDHLPQVSVLIQQLLSNIFKDEIVYPERVDVDIPMSIAKVKKKPEEPAAEQLDKTVSPKAKD